MAKLEFEFQIVQFLSLCYFLRISKINYPTKTENDVAYIYLKCKMFTLKKKITYVYLFQGMTVFLHLKVLKNDKKHSSWLFLCGEIINKYSSFPFY